MKAIILAAGEGTRMRSALAKPMHRILGEPMLDYVISACKDAGISELVCVVGHNKQEILDYFKEDTSLSFATQSTNKEDGYGTGFAVMEAKSFIKPEDDYIILFGDTPLIRWETIDFLIKKHEDGKNAFSFLSAIMDSPAGYGRIVREEDFLRIVEEKDTNSFQKEIKEINTGICIFKGSALLFGLAHLSNENAKKEYYLTDTLEILSKSGYIGDVYTYDCQEDILGVNDCYDLHVASTIMQNRINLFWMRHGVRMLRPEQAFIGPKVKLGQDLYIGPNVEIYGTTEIGDRCVLLGNSRIESSKIGNETSLDRAVVTNGEVGEKCTIGPFTYIRPNSKIKNQVKLGDFVEVKNAIIGNGTKASHLAYIGDADVGESVNIGCGVVFVNYDGTKKYRTTVKNHAFIGSNSNLVAPVEVQEYAYVAAGSTITENVEAYTLSIARARQVNKANWVKK